MTGAKRDYRKFFTHPDVAEVMAELLDPQPGQVILEPSAGDGALVRAVMEKCHKAFVFACEFDPQWEHELKKCADVVVIKDFLEYPITPKHSGCIANPPFGNGIDLKAHVDRMKEAVKEGGKLVILVPDDFDPEVEHNTYPIENWAENSDGSTTLIKIIEFTKS